MGGDYPVRTPYMRGIYCYYLSPNHQKVITMKYFKSFFPEVYHRVAFHLPTMFPSLLLLFGIPYYAKYQVKKQYEHHKF